MDGLGLYKLIVHLSEYQLNVYSLLLHGLRKTVDKEVAGSLQKVAEEVKCQILFF